MNKKLKEKIHESFSSVIPITLIVLLLSTTAAPMNLETLMLFLTGAVLLVIGMGFFTLGADMAMMPIGQQAGEQLTRTKKLWLIIACCFVVGIVITVAEPDLQVLARQTPAVPDLVLILTVAVGVGLFLVLAFLRILFRWNLSTLLLLFYSLIFVLLPLIPAASPPGRLPCRLLWRWVWGLPQCAATMTPRTTALAWSPCALLDRFCLC